MWNCTAPLHLDRAIFFRRKLDAAPSASVQTKGKRQRSCVCPERNERINNSVRSVLQLNASPSCYPTISLQSAEVYVPKNDAKSVAYENHTKSA